MDGGCRTGRLESVETQHCVQTRSTARSQVGWSSRGLQCCMQLGEQAGSRHARLHADREVGSRLMRLHVDERAGLVTTHNTACDQVERSGRKLRRCMRMGGLVWSQLTMLRAIRWNGWVYGGMHRMHRTLTNSILRASSSGRT